MAKKVFYASFCLAKYVIRSFVDQLGRTDSAGIPHASSVPAFLIPPSVLVRFERLVTSAPTAPLRLFAGIALLCGLGINRWGDVHHLKSYFVTDDAMVLTTWKSKRKREPMTWAALRIGLGGTDWLTPLVSELRLARPDGFDWIAQRPTTNLKGFTAKPAE